MRAESHWPARRASRPFWRYLSNVSQETSGIIPISSENFLDHWLDAIIIESPPLKHPGQSALGDLRVEFFQSRGLFLGQLPRRRDIVVAFIDLPYRSFGDVALYAGFHEFHHGAARAVVFVLGGGEGFGFGETLVIDVAKAL